MQKLILLVFLFLSLSIYAQPPSNMPPYALCDGNNDGFETFDLSSQIPAILNGLNPAAAVVTFHETLMNSQTGANPITALNAYVNITPQSQTIYIRVVDGGIDVYYTTIDLAVNTATNAGSDGSITICETSLTTINLYSVITGEQSGGTWVRVTGTGGTFNSIVGTYTPIVGATPSTFIYTLTGLAPCSNDSSVATINIIAQPNAGTDGNIAVCDTSTTIVDLFSVITGEQSGGTWTRTSGTGGIFNASAETYTPEIGATTSSFSYRLFGTLTCIDDSSVATVFVNPLPTATISGSTSVCQNSGSAAIILTGAGGIAPYVFTVLNNNGTVLTFLSTATGSITFSVSTATAGTISLLSVQSSGCTQNLSGSPIVTINPAPTANPATLQFCDLMELAIYNLHDADNQITGGATGFSITYHETLTDAEIGANPVGDGGYIPIASPVQTLFASVTNPANGCRSITTLTLNTNNCTSCSDSAPLNLTANNVTDTSLMLSW